MGASLGWDPPGLRGTVAFREVPGVPGASPALRPRALWTLVPTSSAKKAFPASILEIARLLRPPARTHASPSPQPRSTLVPHTPGGLSWPCSPRVLPPRATLCRAVSCQHREKRHRGQRGGLPPFLAERSGRSGCRVGTRLLGCVRGDTVPSSALEHPPPSRCKRRGCAGAPGLPTGCGKQPLSSLETGFLFPRSEK